MRDSSLTGPRHVAIIMDGNGRWATTRGKPRLFGHQAGVRRVREVVEACPDLGVKYLTVFAFSTENWKRSKAEVAGLMALFKRYIMKESTNLRDNGVRVRFIGSTDRLEPKLVSMMRDLEDMTEHNDKIELTVALNYGSRDEIARAVQRVAEDVKSGKIDPQDIDIDEISRNLDTGDLPDPDLIIRTSGETRVSNFLLWQSAYAEYEFTETLWPDFTAETFASCVANFCKRERRFGAVTG
ncbi:MAG: isoprenyl transferase [Marinosulfonomonas sp.]